MAYLLTYLSIQDRCLKGGWEEGGRVVALENRK